MDEREILTWQTYGTAIRELAQTVADSGFRPDIVLGIARGGLIPAGSVAYALDCKNLFTMNVEFYTGVGTTRDEPTLLPPFLDLAELDDLSVLVVDDVADSGKTLELVARICWEHAGDVRSAVIFEKPRSVIKPDYVWRKTDRWINFPWSSEAVITPRTGVVDA
ncbi:phosphoribosyltransferase [Aeromicrobium sp. 636]|uniref:Phosphoribosyltransferase n=1 Tax=Aeromicrobium senzhongii TaxID=2663859 RepID=A0A8I0ESX4_9ACTN|nr:MULTISPECIES: phosphoribosyltransferase [Aeromicrobium]MBC9225033.1 phosphoribosyltransferase [Aeromicrobium senzhongii]MCQ3997144.1 phosphoribosyltransferase [Aeromicrobium sp. 636]MTB87085.1 phosphoribosyltransferase [Aeromicrobium senzhongii]QNL93099.1 phosphoribosyltransferase [Aeromicrobium senzhongii]